MAKICNTTPCKCKGDDPCGSYRRDEKPRSPFDLSTGMGPRRLERFLADAKRSLIEDVAGAFVRLVTELQSKSTPPEGCSCAFCESASPYEVAHFEDKEAPGWIVWERVPGHSSPYIRAIDTSEEAALRHVKYLKDSARMTNQPPPDLLIEETRINHLYAARLTEALSKRRDKGY